MRLINSTELHDLSYEKLIFKSFINFRFLKCIIFKSVLFLKRFFSILDEWLLKIPTCF